MAATEGKAKVPKAKPTHPTFLVMAKDAVVSLAEKKGSSVQKIQTFIAEKYILDSETVRQHLKPALAKGLESGTFVRPKDSDSKGFTGRFKINKDKITEEAKAQKEKEKKLEKKTVKTASSKSPTKKVVKKTAPKTIATKSPKKATAKAKVVAKPKATIKVAKPKTTKATLKTPKKTPMKKMTKKSPKSTTSKTKK